MKDTRIYETQDDFMEDYNKYKNDYAVILFQEIVTTNWTNGCTEFNGKKAYMVTYDTVGQYTGLKDKNGKKIYKGDKVKTSGGPASIEWFNHGWIVLYGDNAVRLGISHDNLSDYEGHELEVIGNIHEKQE